MKNLYFWYLHDHENSSYKIIKEIYIKIMHFIYKCTAVIIEYLNSFLSTGNRFWQNSHRKRQDFFWWKSHVRWNIYSKMCGVLWWSPQSHNTKWREHASQENGKKVMQIFSTRMCNVTARRHWRLRAHWLMALFGGGVWGRVGILLSQGIAASRSYLSFVYGRSLGAELSGEENSLHWKANMLPLFRIIFMYSFVSIFHVILCIYISC